MGELIPFDRAERMRAKHRRTAAATNPAPRKSLSDVQHDLSKEFGLDTCWCISCRIDRTYKRGRYAPRRPDGSAS